MSRQGAGVPPQPCARRSTSTRRALQHIAWPSGRPCGPTASALRRSGRGVAGIGLSYPPRVVAKADASAEGAPHKVILSLITRPRGDDDAHRGRKQGSERHPSNRTRQGGGARDGMCGIRFQWGHQVRCRSEREDQGGRRRQHDLGTHSRGPGSTPQERPKDYAPREAREARGDEKFVRVEHATG